MRKITFLLLSLVSFFIMQSSYGQCLGDIVLLTQDEVDNFAADNFGCTTITGDLIIGPEDELQSSDITNLLGLSDLTFIGDDLIIQNNDSLINLVGLNGITYVDRFVKILSNASLENLQGLNSLTFANDVDIIENDALLTLSGLENFNLTLSFSITSNNSLISIDELSSLEELAFLFVEDNMSLESCCVILNILDLDVAFAVVYNGNAPSCNSEEGIIDYCYEQKIIAQAFYDENQNDIKDGAEQYLSANYSLSPLAIYGFTNDNYESLFYLDAFGDYTLSINDNPLWQLNSGFMDSIEIAVIDDSFSDSLFIFPLSPTIDIISQDIDITSSIIRCNQVTNFWLTYTNSGTIINDGYIQLIPDELTNFVSASPPADSVAGDTLYWFYENLYPTHSEQINLLLGMPGVDNLGDTLVFEANIETWEGFGDDKAILSAELICAYDPNDKLVLPTGVGPENYTLFEDTLAYTIRFQNTGNDTAFTVVIRDTLDANLDLASFRPISSSHTVSTSLEISSRIVTFTLDNIYLPDSFVNEPASHGFVKFEIKPNTNLVNFTPIANTAGIFFDFNPPIVTNTVSNNFTDNIPLVFFGKILLEGAYETDGMMSTDLATIIPLTQPFSNPPFNYEGIETLDNVPNNMVDWVLVEARTGTPNLAGSKGTMVVETQAGILLNTGEILNVDGTTGIRFIQLNEEEEYYFCIRHRNHLAVLSNTAVSGSEEIYYDFTENVNAAFGPEQLKSMGDGYTALFSGDANQDGIILNTDFDIWFENNALINSYGAADFNLDGINQTTDYDLWFLNKAKVGVIEIQY